MPVDSEQEWRAVVQSDELLANTPSSYIHRPVNLLLVYHDAIH